MLCGRRRTNHRRVQFKQRDNLAVPDFVAVLEASETEQGLDPRIGPHFHEREKLVEPSQVGQLHASAAVGER